MSMEMREQAAQQGKIADGVRAWNHERTRLGSYDENAAHPSLHFYHVLSLS
jgi:hypothetical protein